MTPQTLVMFTYFLQFLSLSSSLGTPQYYSKQCKPIPGDLSWPSPREWASLNFSLSGRLISPPPPGGVCHPTYPTFNALKCPLVMAGWRLNAFHASDPISNNINNWNNDSCLPVPGFPCTGAGYPVYVINATSAVDVKKGVDFARRTGVRLNVKGTGHDYLGRSQSPNSLSIWTRHIQGLTHFPAGDFKPKSCGNSKVTTAAITVAAGVPMIEINEFAASYNLTVVSGGAATVGLGGYTSGGGHGAISPIFGLAADNILEIEVVTPKGDIVTANEYQNTDLFWALRGGGGGTFGIATTFTIRALPSFRYAVVHALLGTPSQKVEAFWNGHSTLLSYFPSMADKGIAAYTETATSFNTSSLGIPLPFLVNGIIGTFNLPLIYPSNTTASFLSILDEAFAAAKQAGGEADGVYWINSLTLTEYPDFFTWWKDNNGPQDGGNNILLGSRLLTKQALTSNLTALTVGFSGAAKSGSITSHLVAGPGVHDTSKIPGDSNSVNPAWRKAYLHVVLGVSFPPLNPAEQKRHHDLLTNEYTQYLRDLDPDSGAYVNEADVAEPDYERAFWGSNYERLATIKKKVDPEGVLWCKACVRGKEWEERIGGDGKLRVCRN